MFSRSSLTTAINSETTLSAGEIHPGNPGQQNGTRRHSLLCALYPGMMLLVLLLTTTGPAPAQTERFHWKPVNLAQVKLDDKTPIAFNVYQPDKKKDSHFVLVLLGRRYIELDIKAKLAYNVLLTDVQKKGSDIESDNFAVPARLLATSGWSVRDVGPAELIKLTLGDYGRVLEVELPHPPDMRAFY